ncbi:hypothetical protein MKW94_007285 [Papaver nudicaule]|uniref:Agglutinin domain-containing protein n=1 Tax=Papaver nudicaule TaxID=74823 RepID=A0AA41V823_PAPNU|nr:hypothetical protein [Papaver nudicaule]
MELPRFFALQGIMNSKYLIHKKGPDAPDMKCIGEEIVSPHTKFEAEMPEMGNNDRGLVHIRCCYNNKYWVKESEEYDMIAPRATIPEEDDTKWSCTMFEPVFSTDFGDTRIVFKHVNLNRPLLIHNDGFIRVGQESGSQFAAINWESLLVLPKYIAFRRGDEKYLNVIEVDGDLGFTSDDSGDPTVGQRVVTNGDGSILLRSGCQNKYWARDTNDRIMARLQEIRGSSRHQSFQPIKVDDDIIALRSLGNNMFCRSCKDGDDKYCLKADAPTISRDTHFKEDGRIYDETMITMASGDVVNRTNVADTVDLKFSYQDTRTSSWNFSGSLTLGVTCEMEAGIPFICDGKVELSGSVTMGVQHTTTTTTTRLGETVYKVNVPAHTSVKVNLKATKGKCDVPYSYTQRDTYINGETETYKKDDGVFTGTNCYHLSYHTEEEALT